MKTKKQLESENCNSKMNKKEILKNMFYLFTKTLFRIGLCITGFCLSIITIDGFIKVYKKEFIFYPIPIQLLLGLSAIILFLFVIRRRNKQ